MSCYCSICCLCLNDPTENFDQFLICRFSGRTNKLRTKSDFLPKCVEINFYLLPRINLSLANFPTLIKPSEILCKEKDLILLEPETRKLHFWGIRELSAVILSVQWSVCSTKWPLLTATLVLQITFLP